MSDVNKLASADELPEAVELFNKMLDEQVLHFLAWAKENGLDPTDPNFKWPRAKRR